MSLIRTMAVAVPQVPVPSRESFPWGREVLSTLRAVLGTPQEYLDQLDQLGPIQAVLLAAVGVVFLIWGWKLFKTLVVVDAAALGVVLGASALPGQNAQIFGAAAGGLLFGILAWPLMKYAVSLLGGLAGAFIGYSMWHYVAGVLNRPEAVQHAWAGALIGLVTLGLLAFIIFRITVIVITALQGSVMIISGSLSLLMLHPPARETISSQLQNPHLMPLLIFIPTVIGVTLQHSLTGKKPAKKE